MLFSQLLGLGLGAFVGDTFGISTFFVLLIAIYIFYYLTARKLPQKNTLSDSVPTHDNVLSFVLSPRRFLRGLLLRRSPSYLALPRGGAYLVLPGEQMKSLFRHSRDLIPAPSLFSALVNFFGLPREDFKVFEHAHISDFERCHGFVTSHSDPSRRVMEHQRRDFAMYLRGDSLKSIMDRFQQNFLREAFSTGKIPSEDYVDIPDLFKFMASCIFRAEVEAIYGEQLFVVSPSLFDEFWAFYEAFPTLAKKLPRWLFPSGYKTQQRILKFLHEWRSRCDAEFDWNSEELRDIEYEPIWGTQYVRRMVKRHKDLGFSDIGVAAAMLGYLFVTVANTIPAALWMMLYILRDEELAEQVRAELSTIFTPNSDRPNMQKLVKAPRLNSIYYETLRLRVAGPVARISPTKTFWLSQRWVIRPGVPIMSTNWLGGLDDSFWNKWNSADGQPQYPTDTFWAERFLKSAAEREGEGGGESAARIVTRGLQGHWFPFGGGSSRCPGEDLAKQTILSAVVLMMRYLDVKLMNPSEAAKVDSGHRTFPFGSHGFNRAVPIRVRPAK